MSDETTTATSGVETFHATMEELLEKMARDMRADNFRDGWEAAIEAAAKMIEEPIPTTQDSHYPGWHIIAARIRALQPPSAAAPETGAKP